MGEKLFKWFAFRRERKILSMARRHIDLTTGTVEELVKQVEAASVGDEDRKQASFERLSKMEMEADSLRRSIAEELTKGVIPPEEREDLMHLIRRVDWVADWAREAGRILSILPFEKAPEEMRKAVLEMCKKDSECVLVLRKCINTLIEDVNKALELADRVERLEEEIDEAYAQVRQLFVSLRFPGFNVGELILFNMFVDAVEMVADWCENTADLVRVIAVRLR